MRTPEDEPQNAVFRFYGELGDFLRPARDGCERVYAFRHNPSVKDAIEAQGVPHPEVALILVNGEPAGFGSSLAAGARVAVFPAFRSLSLPAAVRLREPPSGEPRFVLDVNLGKLARWLRLLGFDALYRSDYRDAEVAAISAHDGRVALTRDRRLLHHKIIEHGYWVRADRPEEQILEVVRRYGLQPKVRSFHRCTECNGIIHPARKEDVWSRLEPKTKRYYEEFYQCGDCRRVYWRGSHYGGLLEKLDHALRGGAHSNPAS